MTTPTQGEHAQTEALRLADWLQSRAESIEQINAAAELRRLHAQVVALTAQPAAPQGVVYAELPDERAAFEAWIRKDCGDLSTFGSGQNIHYSNSAVNNAWTGWKARASHGQAPAGAAPEPIAYLHDDGYWTPAKNDEGRKLNDRLHFAGSPKIGVHLTPTAQAAPAPVLHLVHSAFAEVAMAFPKAYALHKVGIADTAVREALAAPAAGTVAGEVVPLDVALHAVEYLGMHNSASRETEMVQMLRKAAAPTPAAQADSQTAPERSTSPLSEFRDGQWWVQELNKIWGAHTRKIAVTDDLKRAVAVVHHLLRAVRETEAAATPAAQADSVLEDAMGLVNDIDTHMRSEWSAGRLPAVCWPLAFSDRIKALRAARKQGGKHD